MPTFRLWFSQKRKRKQNSKTVIDWICQINVSFIQLVYLILYKGTSNRTISQWKFSLQLMCTMSISYVSFILKSPRIKMQNMESDIVITFQNSSTHFLLNINVFPGLLLVSRKTSRIVYKIKDEKAKIYFHFLFFFVSPQSYII